VVGHAGGDVRTILKIPFLRALILASVAVAAAFPAFEALVIYPGFEEVLVQKVEDEALHTGQHLAFMLGLDRNGASVAQIAAAPGFAAKSARLAEDFELWGLQLLGPDGTVHYASRPADIDQLERHDHFRQLLAVVSPRPRLIHQVGRHQAHARHIGQLNEDCLAQCFLRGRQIVIGQHHVQFQIGHMLLDGGHVIADVVA